MNKSCIVIGAGMAGLTAARELQMNGWQVTVLDKGRGVGGRLATRRLENAKADHGAQYFSARTDVFQRHVSQLKQAGVIRDWELQEAEIGDTSFSHSRFIGSEGMNSIAKYLSEGLDLRTNERVVRVAGNASTCTVTTESENQYQADKLIITIPAPQALTLLRDSHIELAPADLAAFDTISYAPCVAVMVLLNEHSRIPSPGAIKFEQGPVAWVADNYQKGISDQPCVTIHASAEFSRQHMDEDLNSVADRLISHVADWLGNVKSYQVHRWRYSLAEKRHPQAYLVGNTPFTMLFGGDGFGMGNIEGAFQSGLQMAQYLIK